MLIKITNMNKENAEKILLKLRRLSRQLKALNDVALSMGKAVKYSGLSKSHLYKLTSGNELPYYKPKGKMIFFRKSELDKFLLSNRISTKEELELKANKIHSKLKR